MATNATLIPWDRHADTVSAQHQMRVASIINSLIEQGVISQTSSNPATYVFNVNVGGQTVNLSTLITQINSLVSGLQSSAGYFPVNPSNWQGMAPGRVQDALDRLAAALASLGRKP